MVITRNKAVELFNSWKKLTELHAKQGKLILDLIGHPECTLDHIAQAMPEFQKTREALKKHRPVVLTALEKHALHRLASDVRVWRP